MKRRDLLRLPGGLALASAIPAAEAQPALQTLRVGMTTSDTPTTGGIPDNGSEGGRFAGLYDLRRAGELGFHPYRPVRGSDAGPGDGMADRSGQHAALDLHAAAGRAIPRWHDPEGRGYSVEFRPAPEREIAAFRSRAGPQLPHLHSQVVRYEKIDDTHVALYTAEPFSMLPYLLSRVFIVSPTQYAKIGNWLDFQRAPAAPGLSSSTG